MILRKVVASAASFVLVLLMHEPTQVNAQGGRKQADAEADAMVPVEADIQKLRNARLTVGEKEIRATIFYYQHKTVVVLLPVWVTDGEVELLLGEGARAQPHKVGSNKPLLPEGIADRVRLRVRVRDLVSHPESQKAVRKKLTEELRERGAGGQQGVQFGSPKIDERSYQVTLCTRGNGKIAEVELSETAVLSPRVVEAGDIVELELVPKAFAERRAHAREVKLEDTYLRINGLLWCRMETEQVRATVDTLSQALVKVQHQLGSDPDKVGGMPVTAIVQVAGGNIEMNTTLTRMVSQHIRISLMSREGTAQKPDLVIQLARELFRQQLKQLPANELKDGREITFLIENLAALSGTVGEIKELARKNHKEREQGLKAAWGAKAKLRLGALQPEVSEDKAVAITNKALDEVAEYFAGKVPTLMGIHFQQAGAAAANHWVQGMIDQGVFRTAWVQHDWPVVDFALQQGAEMIVKKAPQPKPAKMADCVGSWRMPFGGGSIDMDLKADGTAAFTDRPDKPRAWVEGGGFVSEGKGNWSVDNDGRLTVKMTHAWVGVFWMGKEITWLNAERISEVTNTEIVLLNGDRLRRR
jgi:hypothetical protein